jgi:dCTP deaminase
LAVQNTVFDPGFRGFCTIELTNHGNEIISIRSGTAIAQMIFHRLDEPTEIPYKGKYQDQQAGPQEAR